MRGVSFRPQEVCNLESARRWPNPNHADLGDEVADFSDGVTPLNDWKSVNYWRQWPSVPTLCNRWMSIAMVRSLRLMLFESSMPWPVLATRPEGSTLRTRSAILWTFPAM